MRQRSRRCATWPGNIRELENVLERVTYLMPTSTVTIDDLPVEFRQPHEHREVEKKEGAGQAVNASKPPLPQRPIPLEMDRASALKEQSHHAERHALVWALESSGGQLTRAAALLGISRTTLWRKMAKYELLHERKRK